MDWRICALLAAFFAAVTALLAKAGVRNIDSNLATAIRTAVILPLAWSIVLFTGAGGQIRQIGAQNWLFLVLSGFATGLSWLFYFRALQLGSVSKVAPIDKLSVAITILLAILFLHVPADAKVILGGLLITAGSMVLLM